MSETYRTHFKRSKAEFFMKERFEVEHYCNNRLNSSNRNVISRILNTFIAALNNTKVMTALEEKKKMDQQATKST